MRRFNEGKREEKIYYTNIEKEHINRR